MLKFAIKFGGPIALRYPRGEAYDGLKDFRDPIVFGKAEWLVKDRQVALIAVGSMVKTALTVRNALVEKGCGCSIINARFVKPIDTEIIEEALKNHTLIVTMEENVASGGFGEKVRDYLGSVESNVKLLNITLPDEYVEHGNVEILRKEVGIDAETIEDRILQMVQGEA